MEKKQLDFNAPILSVRRIHSSKASNGDTSCSNKNSLASRWKSLPPSYRSDMELAEVTKPVAVPFMWEHIPGRAKGGSDSEPQTPVKLANNLGKELVLVQHLSNKAFEDRTSLRPGKETFNFTCDEGSDTKRKNDSESEDVSYSDAQDTLSLTESGSLNCSSSGFSGYDGLGLRTSGTFNSDPQTRDYMMSRFLPAAKAMVLETPHYVPRKQPAAAPERPKPMKKVVSGEQRPLLEQYRSYILPHYNQYNDDVEAEDEEDEYDRTGNKSAKACGLLPRFCTKNSLCLLNPMPGMKVRTQVPMSSSGELSRLTRTTRSGPLRLTSDKHALDAGYRKTTDSGVQSQELYEVGNKLPTRNSNQLTYSSELPVARGLSPHRRSQGGGISPYRNGSPRSPFHEGAKFLGVPKVVETKANRFNLCNKNHNDPDVSSDQRYIQRSGPVSPAVEKMLYIDSVNTVFIPSETKGHLDSSGEDIDTFVENKMIKETRKTGSSVQDIRILDVRSRCTLNPSDSGSLEAAEKTGVTRVDQSSNQEPAPSEYSIGFTDETLNAGDVNHLEGDEQENPDIDPLQSPAPPPLPKSPSESWLWRALPSISARNSFSGSKVGSQFFTPKQSPRASSPCTKWETIVKTSNVHYDHVRYSEELVPHVFQHSKP